MAERLQAVLLDFDHTLTDFGNRVRWADARPAVQRLYREGGVPEAFLNAHPGSITLYTAVAALRPLPADALAEVQRRASRVLAEFEAEGMATTEARPGAATLASTLEREWGPSGLRAGIVTSNAASVVAAILERLGLAAPFEVIIGRDEVARLKPDPEGLLTACRALGSLPPATVYVGDSTADIEAARSAGMRAWAVATGHGREGDLRASGAERVFATLGAVTDAMLARLAGDSAPTGGR